MRNRLIASFVGLTVLVIALYGVPRAYILADLVQTQEQRKIDRTADLVEVVILDRQERAAAVTPELLQQLLHDEERLEYTPVQGATIGAGDAGTASDESVTTTRVLPDGSQITLSRSGALVSDRVADALTPLVLIGLALVALAALVAVWLSERLSRPFRELADSAHHLGTGDFGLTVPRYDVPEADMIGTALQDSARRLDVLVRREREFTVQASHLLRTPITALRLDLEDVALWPQTPPEVAAHLTSSIAELDRLSASITHLLAASQADGSDEAAPFDLQDEVRSRVEARTAAGTSGETTRVRFVPSSPLDVRLPRQPVQRAVDLLLNHLTEGPGSVTVEVVDRGTHAVVRMLSDRDVVSGTPQHEPLDAARELVTALGGTIVLAAPPDHGVEVMLPRARSAD